MFPDAVAYAIPFFILAFLLEAWTIKRRASDYHLKDAATSLAMGMGNHLVAISFGTAYVLFFYRLVYDYRLIDDLPISVWTVSLCFFLDDFFYYWFHRCSHERRWFWASHVVHHSSQHYNLTTALRQTWTGKLSFTFIFSMPLVFIGFPPEMVLFVYGVNLVYQFWIHTELITKLGPLEWILNTPSHHRVHHATNPGYLDANYGGVFIIWDRLFGTFVPESASEPVKYGIIKNLDTYNPFRVAFHEWAAMGRDLVTAKSWSHRVKYIFAEPGWTPDGSRETTKMIKARWLKDQTEKQLKTPE